MPEEKVIVINTGPLIALTAATGSLDILQHLYSRVIVPFEVGAEILAGGQTGFAVPEFQAAAFLDKQPHPATIGTFLHNTLDTGEASVMLHQFKQLKCQGQAPSVKGWLKALKDDKTLLVHAAAQGQKAADYILNLQAD